MKIERDGQEYDLTLEEMDAAYREMEIVFDVDDIKNEIYFRDDGFEDYYGVPGDSLTEEEINNAAYLKRKYMDKYGCDFEYARHEAIRDVIAKRKIIS